MKKFMLLIVCLMCLLTLSSCLFGGGEAVSMMDALQISAILLNEEDGSYNWEVLKLNEEREMLMVAANNNGMKAANMPLHFAYEGTCEIICEEKDIFMSVNKNAEFWEDSSDFANQTFGYEHRISNGGYIAINPYGSDRGERYFSDKETIVRFKNFVPYPGKEYYITVNALDYNDVPVIRAKLKLVQLESLSGEPDLENKYTSPFFAIELVQYEYSDEYKMMEGVQ